jgi:MinD-like ATPase involved in chromosome partitioning or flagellar assembly
VAGKTILVIDSDVASRNFISRTLQKQEHEVVQVGTGKEGLIVAWRDHPHLIIIEPNLPDLKGEELAARLRHDPRTSHTPLVALSFDHTSQRMKACRDAGFNEFIAKSGDAVANLLEVMDNLFSDGAPGRRQGGLTISFLGAKGGIGTSSLCANLATNITQNQPELRVAVVDLVLPIGSIGPIVGYDGEQNLVSAADLGPGESTAHYFREHLTLIPHWNFHLLAGSPDPESANHLQVTHIHDILQGIKQAYDFVLLDLGRSLARFSIQAIQQADLTALVIGTDASAVSLAGTVLKYLHSKGIADTALYPILNRAGGLEGMSKSQVDKELGLEIKAAVPYLGSHFAMSNDQHVPFSLKFPRDTASMVFRDCASQMVQIARRMRAG